jgi:hypothetical protein
MLPYPPRRIFYRSLEQVRDSIDRMYISGMVSTGIGTPRIIIGAFALTRRGSSGDA